MLTSQNRSRTVTVTFKIRNLACPLLALAHTPHIRLMHGKDNVLNYLLWYNVSLFHHCTSWFINCDESLWSVCRLAILAHPTHVLSVTCQVRVIIMALLSSWIIMMCKDVCYPVGKFSNLNGPEFLVQHDVPKCRLYLCVSIRAVTKVERILNWKYTVSKSYRYLRSIQQEA